mgnify:CR=1 FL=1|jgi:hypothetical protein
MFHELLAATTDMAVLPGVLGCRTLRRTVQVRLESNTLRFPGGTSIFTVSRQQFMKHPGNGGVETKSRTASQTSPG